MTFALALFLSFSPAAYAETYHLAACDFAKTTSGWVAAGAIDGTREAVNGVMVKISQASNDGGGYCDILRGTGDETSADVLLNSASGSGISVSPSCEFRGQLDNSKTVHQTLGYGESASVDFGPQQREGVYFASPEESANANWVSSACQKMASSLSGVKTAGSACRLPKDQGMGSLHGSWTKLPIPLVFDREFDRHGETAALKRAVATWNRFGATQGKTLFVIQKEAEIPNLTDCSQSSYTATLRGAVGVWRIDGSRSHTNERSSCGINPDGSFGKLLAQGTQGQTDWEIEAGKIRGASVLLNLVDYNRPGRDRLDLESELLHELGHVLGLLHSCNGSSGSIVDDTSAPACFAHGTLSAPKAYADAAMFPFLEPGQVKRILGENDLARAACLY